MERPSKACPTAAPMSRPRRPTRTAKTPSASSSTKPRSTVTASALAPTFGIPGGKGAQALPLPRLSLREGEVGWATQGLLPPPSVGERAQVKGWLPDFSKTSSKRPRLGNPRLKALMRAVDRQTAEHHNHLPLYKARILLRRRGSRRLHRPLRSQEPSSHPKTGGTLIAAAVDGATNLYAWDRASGEVSLAGVMNDETAPGQGRRSPVPMTGRAARTAHLKVGGAARNYYLQDEHAITADGDVYFTAGGTGQLYLRVNPTEPQSAMSGEECTEAQKTPARSTSRPPSAPTPDPAGARPPPSRPPAPTARRPSSPPRRS